MRWLAVMALVGLASCEAPPPSPVVFPYHFTLSVTGPRDVDVYYQGRKLEWLNQAAAPYVTVDEVFDDNDAWTAFSARIVVKRGDVWLDGTEVRLTCVTLIDDVVHKQFRAKAESLGFDVRNDRLFLAGSSCDFEDGSSSAIIND